MTQFEAMFPVSLAAAKLQDTKQSQWCYTQGRAGMSALVFLIFSIVVCLVNLKDQSALLKCVKSCQAAVKMVKGNDHASSIEFCMPYLAEEALLVVSGLSPTSKYFLTSSDDSAALVFLTSRRWPTLKFLATAKVEAAQHEALAITGLSPNIPGPSPQKKNSSSQSQRI